MHKKPNPISHGGTRPNAGRKSGSSPYGEQTRVMRVPESTVSAISDMLAAHKAKIREARLHQDIQLPALDAAPVHIPLFSHKVPAGFPSPADDYIQTRLSLDEHLVHRKESTFFVRAKGNSMTGAGIMDGDLLVVDKSLTPKSGDIVIAAIDGELTVKRLIHCAGEVSLHAENPRFKDITFKEGQELQIWGVVTSCVTKFQ